MKILLATPIFPPEIGGPATYSYEVSRRLVEKGHDVRIVTFTDAKPKVENVEVIPVRLNYGFLGTLRRQLRLFFTLLRAARGMDLLYAQGAVVVGFCSLIVGKLLKKPVVVKFVGDVAWEQAVNTGKTNKLLEEFLIQPDGGLYIKLIMRIQRFVFHQAARVITPSYYLKNLLVEFYQVPSSKIEVVYNAVELVEVKAAKEKYGQPMAITIGRLVAWKGIDELITLVPALTEKYHNFKLLVVGDGPERDRLKQHRLETGVEPYVIFTGIVNHEQTLALLKRADVFILNSKYEGLPHTVIEAMACRCPVIATGLEGTREVIEDGRNGITIEPGNTQQLQEKLVFLLENEPLRQKMIAEAYETVVKKFTWGSTLGELEQILSLTAR
ncbi:MAG: glycosyltransferase family 4 protein [Chloroflexota bacterium]|nr:glycosyltransferase family 4 protein [Chloroflexota bacterium]